MLPKSGRRVRVLPDKARTMGWTRSTDPNVLAAETRALFREPREMTMNRAGSPE
jgi:hypothetical protein